MTDTPTEQLRQDHELVLMVGEAIEREIADIGKTGRVHRERVAQMVDFAQNFTDGCHHSKEERVLFPTLEERDAAAGGPVNVMLSEHEVGREAIRAIDAALPDVDESEAARTAVAGNLALYAHLLRLHINKENQVLFPLAERILSDQEQEMLAAEFERIEEEETGAGVHERYRELAHTLATPPADD